MRPDSTDPTSWDYLVELRDDGEQSAPPEPEVITIPPAPRATGATPAPPGVLGQESPPTPE